VHGGLQDLLPIVGNVTADMRNKIDMEPYTRDQFVGDIMRLGNGRSDVALVGALVDNSRAAIQWLADEVKVPFIFSFHRQAYEVDGRQKFWGGMALSVEDGGKGLILAHQKALKAAGIETWFNTAAEILLRDERGAIRGLKARRPDGDALEILAPAVVLAAGGFEASAELREKHLGPGWGKAMVRGTIYNTGDGFSMAEQVGAKLVGDWAGCHSVAWDANAPHIGDRIVTNQYTKSGYPLGIMVNSAGKRFVDEGEDFRNYTYAKIGRAVMEQPGGYAFQIWDQRGVKALRKEEYGDDVVKKITGDNVDELARKLVPDGLRDVEAFKETFHDYNEAVLSYRKSRPKLTYDPAVKDGCSTGTQLEPPKTNWALPLDQHPLVAVKVACGVTFTFGGLKIEPETSQVISEEGSFIPGLYCTGEMLGGLSILRKLPWRKRADCWCCLW